MARRRHVTEIAQCVTWVEINAYADGLPMRRWEKEMIAELDDIAIGIWRKEKTGDKGPTMIPATDSEGLREMFERLAARQKG